MKIVIIEPLGITPEKLAEATAAVKARGHEIVAYDTKEEDQDKLAERGKDADIIIINKPAGMLSQPADDGESSLVEYLIGYLLKKANSQKNS